MAIGKTVLVTGSRDLPSSFDKDMSDLLAAAIGWNDTIIEGEAPGVDRFIRDWAAGYVAVRPYPADWEGFGRAAGPLRNQQMLDENPDIVLCLAFPAPDSRGTWDMLRRAVSAGIETRVYPLVKGATWTSS